MEIDEQVLDLKPWVPAKDFAASRQFFLDLGLKIAWEMEGLAEFQLGAYRFILQDAYKKEWADNLMLHVMVKNADWWVERIAASGVTTKYPGVRATPAEDKPWGLREVNLIDPAGVCWHFAQKKAPAANP